MKQNNQAHGKFHAKRGMALLMVLCMLMMAIPISVNASTPQEENGYQYVNGYFVDGGYLGEDSRHYDGVTICGYKGTETNLVIPTTLGGKPVKGIDGRAFENCTFLKSVTLHNQIRYIGIYAFANCSGLESVFMGNGVKSLYGTFAGCISLKNISIGTGVELLKATFDSCCSLEEIIIPKSVKYIFPDRSEGVENDTFGGCDSLKKVVFLGDTFEDVEMYPYYSGYDYENYKPFTIVCHENSDAHKLAVESDYKFPYEFIKEGDTFPVTSITDEGVIVTANQNVFPDGTEFKSEPVTSGSAYDAAKGEKNIFKFVAYDITASNQNAAVQPNGVVNVTFDVPKDFDLSKTAAYYISNDGKLELIQSSTDESTRKITASLTHFSIYAIAETANNATENPGISSNVNQNPGTSGNVSQGPQTGDSGMVTLWILLSLLSVAVIVTCIILIRRKNRKKID